MSDPHGWFFASLLFSVSAASEDAGVVRECNYLVLAGDPDEALAKAQKIGADRASDVERFLGVEELLSIDGEVQDGAELVWREREWTEADLKSFIEKKVQSRALLVDADLSPVGWYVGEIALLEVVKGGDKAQDLLAWRNVYLIKEPDANLAFQRLEIIGNLEQDAGEHTSDGNSASWKFLGVSMLQPVAEEPSDGSLLWCEPRASLPTETVLPSRDELGVFRWLRM